MPVRIAVSDPLPLFSHGVAEALKSDGYEVESPTDLFAWSKDAGPHVILLSLLAPADWTLLAELRDNRPQTALIAVIENGDVGSSVRALTAGAVGVMAREADTETVRGVLSAAASGRSLLPVDVLRALTSPPSRPVGDRNLVDTSARPGLHRRPAGPARRLLGKDDVPGPPRPLSAVGCREPYRGDHSRPRERLALDTFCGSRPAPRHTSSRSTHFPGNWVSAPVRGPICWK